MMIVAIPPIRFRGMLPISSGGKRRPAGRRVLGLLDDLGFRQELPRLLSEVLDKLYIFVVRNEFRPEVHRRISRLVVGILENLGDGLLPGGNHVLGKPFGSG